MSETKLNESAVDEHLDAVLEAEEAVEQDERAADPDDQAEDPALEADADPEARREIDDPEEHPEDDPDDDRRAQLDLVKVADILGVPLFYERAAGGSRPTSFFVARPFLPTIEATVKQLQERIPASFGPLQKITSAGMLVSKAGRHGEGRACDWDRLTFANAEIAPIERDHASPSIAKRRHYWAFAAICRSNSSFVLHGLYNAEHADHIHSDNTTGAGFAFSESTVKLLQAVLNDIHGAQPALDTDGDFGPNTKTALQKAQAKLGLTGDIGDLTVWRQFLRRSARLGFTLPG
jgi:hypothetical protein